MYQHHFHHYYHHHYFIIIRITVLSSSLSRIIIISIIIIIIIIIITVIIIIIIIIIYLLVGSSWSRIRRLTAPSFSLHNIKQKVNIIFMESLLFIKSIESYAIEQKVIDMRQDMLHYTLHTISKIALGTNLSKSLYASFEWYYTA